MILSLKKACIAIVAACSLHINYIACAQVIAGNQPFHKTQTYRPISHKPHKQQNAAARTHIPRQAHTTFIVLMAADNDLYPFAGRNLNQMEKIGSNNHINIFVHLDMHRAGHPKTTKHYVIEKGKRIQIGPDLCMDSGDPETLIHTVKLATEVCPAQNYVLILWNHGTGPLEPRLRKSVNPSTLFYYNEKTKMIELDRSIGFLDYITHQNELPAGIKNDDRGICFDDTTGNFLTIEKLKFGIRVCTRDIIRKKFALIGFDACLMNNFEVCWSMKDDAEVQVGSQDVELGTGWNYALALEKYISEEPSAFDFGTHIVHAYQKAYQKITPDYTQSAINLSLMEQLEKNFTLIAGYLLEAIKKQRGRSVKEAIKNAINRKNCTHFDEPMYKDLFHVYHNLLASVEQFDLIHPQETVTLKNNLKEALILGCQLIEQAVISNTAGPHFKMAKGLSIYFPEQQIHSSYYQCEFAIKTGWLMFLSAYLNTR